ncbi:MAG: rhodanese-like domain-containing protein [Alphaproteobacteria bacterium]|nr:rhodanese-like domain-containing protein [Alphaproteobacteria bacterium]
MTLPPEQVFYVSPDQIQTWRDSAQAVVVDVREDNEWQEAHIPGAILMPLSTFDPAKIPNLGSKHLVFHCRSGRRCGLAAEKAVAAGYKGVIKRMEGGFLAWSAAGYDSEPG